MELLPRKSPRIKYYDYSNANYYFITICTHRQKCLFGLPDRRTNLGIIAEKHIAAIERHYHCVHVDKFVVMPNHIHLILVIECGQQVNATQIVGQFKSGVTREIRSRIPNMMLWQRSFHDHVIRNKAGYEKIWTYIENNPKKWEEDCFYSNEGEL